MATWDRSMGPSYYEQTVGQRIMPSALAASSHLKDAPGLAHSKPAGTASDQPAKGNVDYNNRESWVMLNQQLHGSHLPRSEITAK